MSRFVILLLIGGLLALAACEAEPTDLAGPAEPSQAAAEPPQRPTAEGLRSILDKNASFELASFPIGFWNYMSIGNPEQREHINEAEVQDWADAGFTLTDAPRFDYRDDDERELMQNVLDWADQRGIKLIIHDGRTWGEHLPEAVEGFGDHPAVFGFHIADEPNGDTSDRIFAAARRVKAAAPDLHPFVNLGPYNPGNEQFLGVESYADYVDAAAEQGDLDYLCYDNYVQMNPGKEGWDRYFGNLRLMRQGAWRHGIPFWTTLPSVGHFVYRCPNYDELRWQFNTAVCSGATGIQYFFYYMRYPHTNYRRSPVDVFWEKTQTYYDLRKVHRFFHKRYGDLFLRLVPTRVTFLPTAYGGGEVFTPDEVLESVKLSHDDAEALIGEFVDAEGRRYVMVVNNSTTINVYIVLAFPGDDVKLYTYGWDGQEHGGTDFSSVISAWKDGYYKAGYWLAPGQELFQRVDSELIRNSEISRRMRALQQVAPAQQPATDQP